MENANQVRIKLQRGVVVSAADIHFDTSPVPTVKNLKGLQDGVLAESWTVISRHDELRSRFSQRKIIKSESSGSKSALQKRVDGYTGQQTS